MKKGNACFVCNPSFKNRISKYMCESHLKKECNECEESLILNKKHKINGGICIHNQKLSHIPDKYLKYQIRPNFYHKILNKCGIVYEILDSDSIVVDFWVGMLIFSFSTRKRKFSELIHYLKYFKENPDKRSVIESYWLLNGFRGIRSYCRSCI